MSGIIIYLTAAEIVEIHRQTLERMGAEPAALRSEDLLESAAMKPQAAAWYAGSDLAEQAAVLAIGISQNQPFVDGNKRAAYAATRIFFSINGLAIDAPPLDIAQQLIDVAERNGTLEDAMFEFAHWLRERLVLLGNG